MGSTLNTVSDQSRQPDTSEQRLSYLRDIIGRLAQLCLAAVLGYTYSYEVRDGLPEPARWFVLLIVFALVGLAAS